MADARPRGWEMPVRTPDPVSVDRALRRVETLTSVGVALGAVEYLMRPGEFTDTGMLGWRIGRARFRWTARERARVLDPVFAAPGVHVLVALRLAAALALLNPRTDRATRTAATAAVLASGLGLGFRNGYGNDGTEHMNLVTFAALLASRLFPEDAKAREACVRFIAFQSCLSYFAAGLSKATGTSWRDGTAVQGIMRTRSYGTPWGSALLRRRPALSTLLSRATVAGEIGFPLVLVAPRIPALGLLGTGAAFHLGNAVFMGLNRFMWAFCGTYPAVAHCSKSLSPRPSEA